MIKNKVIIFSDSIQSGKTSRVLTWIKDQKSVGGILTPDIGGSRKLMDISEMKLYDLETDGLDQDHIIAVGRFVFLKSGFERAIAILNQALLNPPKLVVIDEVGKLELENAGLEPALSDILNKFSIISTDTIFLIIVRENLLEEVVAKYSFQDVEFVGYKYFTK